MGRRFGDSGRWVVAMFSVACVFAGSARAAPNFVFGFTDNLALSVGEQATGPERALGAGGVSYVLVWHPGEVAPDETQAAELARGVAAASGMRVILSIRTSGAETPLDDAARDQFCSFARNAIESSPSINDLVIGNEPDSSYFWRPQFNPDGSSAAPAAYEALLAHCYDVLHAFRPTINIGAPATGPYGNDNPNAVSNISHSPTSFILKLGAAYRETGRTSRIFDTVVHHPYGYWNDERPYLMHRTQNSIGEGDWNRLVDTYQAAFAGTEQAVPGRCFPGAPCVPIWYLELGFQTDVPPLPGYFGSENVRVVPDALVGEPSSPSPPADSPAPDQATQLGYALRLAYCQPYVEVGFNFLLQDDANLAGYQSGLYRIDGSEKAALPSLRAQIAALAAGAISCAPPTPPLNTVAHATVDGDVELSWSRSSSTIGVSGYSVYRNAALIGTTQNATFVDSTVGRGTQNSYLVRAFDAAGGTSPIPTSRPTMVTVPRAFATAANGAAAKRRGCVVPRVRGRRLRVAKRMLAHAGCRLGHVRRGKVVPARAAFVKAQSPHAGRRLGPRARVNVTVGRRHR